jgi:hypothetical protein
MAGLLVAAASIAIGVMSLVPYRVSASGVQIANCPAGAVNTVQKTNGTNACVASSMTDDGTKVLTSTYFRSTNDNTPTGNGAYYFGPTSLLTNLYIGYGQNSNSWNFGNSIQTWWRLNTAVVGSFQPVLVLPGPSGNCWAGAGLDASNPPDTCLARNGAGVAEVGTTTSGGTGSLILSNETLNGTQNYCSSSSAANTYTCTVTPVPTGYTTGQCFTLSVTNTNTGATTVNVNSLGAKNVNTSLNVAVSAGMIAGGSFYTICYDGTEFLLSPGSIAGSSLYSQTSSITVGNTTAETSVITGATGSGSPTLPAGFFRSGKTIRVTVWGYHSAVSNPTIDWKIKLGSTIVLDTTAISSNNSTNQEIQVVGYITCRTTGAMGTVFSQGRYEELTHLNAQMLNTSTSTIDTTSSQLLDVTVQWGTMAVGNTVTVTNVTVEAF